MKSRILNHANCFAVIALLSLLPAIMAHADDNSLCKFDKNIKQGPAAPAPPQGRPPYFVWRAGGLGDQSTVPGQHSGLVGKTENVDDVTFGVTMNNAIANIDGFGNDYSMVPLVFVFGQCYGGGMIDDLDFAIGPNPISIVTASFFNQTASYPINGGNGSDFVWAYVRDLPGNVVAQPLAAQAATDDPFGWAARPNPARKGETKGSETPEYYSRNNGDNIMLSPPPLHTSVVLWAGQPKQVDDQQLATIIPTLINLGYSKDDIVVLFGGGDPQNSQLATEMFIIQQFDRSHLRPANLKQLQLVANWAFPTGSKIPPRLFFFLAADHGCNNAFMATGKTGNGGDDIEDGDYWETHADDYPPSR